MSPSAASPPESPATTQPPTDSPHPPVEAPRAVAAVPRWQSWGAVLGLTAAVLAAVPTDDMGLLLLLATPLTLVIAWRRGGLGGLRSLGFRAPASWGRLLLIAVLAGVALQGFSLVVIEPFVWGLTGGGADVGAFAAIEGDAGAAAFLLLVIWTLVAFGEEIVFRGFLIGELLNLFGASRGGRVAAVLVSSSLFGIGHLYQGVSGVLITGLMGAVIGTVFLQARRDLWLVILIHGVVDTVAVVALYYGHYESMTAWARALWS